MCAPLCWQYREPLGHLDIEKSDEKRSLVVGLLKRRRVAEEVQNPSPPQSPAASQPEEASEPVTLTAATGVALVEDGSFLGDLVSGGPDGDTEGEEPVEETPEEDIFGFEGTPPHHRSCLDSLRLSSATLNALPVRSMSSALFDVDRQYFDECVALLLRMW